MNKYRADLHIHTLLSPCADLEMTPCRIVKKAKESGLDIIGITDHNSTLNALLVKKMAEAAGIFALTGAEVTTREEVHCLTFFENEKQLHAFQEFIDEHKTFIPNPEGHFGYQPVIDEQENIRELITWYLPAALKVGIHEIQYAVKQLNGIFIPAHIDRQVNGILSQLGFIPPGLNYDALGVLRHGSVRHVKEHNVLRDKTSFIRNSDAHFLKQIGEIYTVFNMKEMRFSEIRKALNQEENRFVEIP